MSNDNNPIFYDIVKKYVSLVVYPIDDYSLQKPLCDLSVYLDKYVNKPTNKADGFFVFINLEAREMTLIIDDSKYYKSVKKKLNLEELRLDDSSFQRNPTIVINLIPNSSYPFPYNATLLKGSVSIKDRNLNSRPAVNANIKINELERKVAITDERGEYLLYFSKLKPDEDILEQEVDESIHFKRRFINMEQSIKFTMSIDCPGFPRLEREYETGIEEGRTTSINFIFDEES